MAMNAKDIQQQIDDGAQPVHARNINIDTHIGQAPQRPFALLEDHMATASSGHGGIQALKASLRNAHPPTGLPDGAPDPNEIRGDEGGYYRVVPSQAVREVFATADGSLRERVRFEKRAVAMSMQAARAASENGTPTDFWNGFTWLRDGWKPERDFQMILQAGQTGAAEDLVFDAPLAPTEAAVVRHQISRANYAQPPAPVEAARPEAARKGKE